MYRRAIETGDVGAAGGGGALPGALRRLFDEVKKNRRFLWRFTPEEEAEGPALPPPSESLSEGEEGTPRGFGFRGAYAGDVGAYDGDVGAYDGDVGAYDGDVGAYDGDVGEYDGVVGRADEGLWTDDVAAEAEAPPGCCEGGGTRGGCGAVCLTGGGADTCIKGGKVFLKMQFGHWHGALPDTEPEDEGAGAAAGAGGGALKRMV